MQERLSFITLAVVLLTSCVPSFEAGLERLDERVIHEAEVEVRWYTTSSITTLHEHVEVVKGGAIVKIAELNAGGISDIVVSNGAIVIESHGGLFYQLEDSAFGYPIILDTIDTRDQRN